jgi:polyribonucleotide nucleotidyltransferase
LGVTSGGSTIKEIQSSTGARIDVESNTGKVVITVANDALLQQTLNQIRAVISYYEATIQVPSHLTGRVIGRGGETINSIRSSTGVRIDVSKDGSGRIVLGGKTSYEVGRAVAMIQAQTGSATYVSVSEGALPVYTEVRSSTATARRIPPTTSSQPIISRQPSAPPPPQPKPQPVVVPSKPAAKPQIHQQEFRITAAQIAILTRKQGGFFATLFGGGKSPLEKIQETTGAQIRIDTSTSIIKIVARSPQIVNQAVTAIQQALR